jgi:hypothetical protein
MRRRRFPLVKLGLALGMALLLGVRPGMSQGGALPADGAQAAPLSATASAPIEELPKTTRLVEDVPFSLAGGKGSILAKAGATVTVVGREGDSVVVEYLGSKQAVPLAKTTLQADLEKALAAPPQGVFRESKQFPDYTDKQLNEAFAGLLARTRTKVLVVLDARFKTGKRDTSQRLIYDRPRKLLVAMTHDTYEAGPLPPRYSWVVWRGVEAADLAGGIPWVDERFKSEQSGFKDDGRQTLPVRFPESHDLTQWP